MTNKIEKPLIKDIKALKELLLWAKTEGILSLEVNGVKAIFTPSALPQNQEQFAPTLVDTRTPEQIAVDRQREEDEILFHSVS